MIGEALLGGFHPGDGVRVRIVQDRVDLVRFANSLAEQTREPTNTKAAGAKAGIDSSLAMRHAARFVETLEASSDEVDWELLQMTFRFADTKSPWHRVWLTIQCVAVRERPIPPSTILIVWVTTMRLGQG